MHIQRDMKTIPRAILSIFVLVQILTEVQSYRPRDYDPDDDSDCESGEGSCCDCEDEEPVFRPHDCATIKKKDSNAQTDMYEIWPKLMNRSIFVQCDMTTENGGWTIFQRRGDFSEIENFFRDWKDYVNGFGKRGKYNEYWIGLDAIHAISNYEPQTLRIDLEDFDNRRRYRYAKYDSFGVGGSGSDYKLDIKGYSGDAGDSLWYHNNQPFDTKDNDKTTPCCANRYKGAWWFNSCHISNLNGQNVKGKQYTTLGHGIHWGGIHGYSLKSSEMKMRPRTY